MKKPYRIIDNNDPSYKGGVVWMTSEAAARRNKDFESMGSSLRWERC